MRDGAEEKKDDPAASAEKILCDIAVGDVFLAAGQSNMGLRSRYGRANVSGCDCCAKRSGQVTSDV